MSDIPLPYVRVIHPRREASLLVCEHRVALNGTDPQHLVQRCAACSLGLIFYHVLQGCCAVHVKNLKLRGDKNSIGSRLGGK